MSLFWVVIRPVLFFPFPKGGPASGMRLVERFATLKAIVAGLADLAAGLRQVTQRKAAMPGSCAEWGQGCSPLWGG